MSRAPEWPPECPNCGELVLPGESHPELRYMQNYHHECAARASIGSVGHILGQCKCYGGDWEDPPLMTRREAAKMALRMVRAGFMAPPRPIKGNA